MSLDPQSQDRAEKPSIARFSVKQPVLVNLIAITLMVTGGFFVLPTMTREVYPMIPIGAATIVTSMPGASPAEIEELITAPIEDEISDVTGVERISSTSSDGLSFIWVEFEASVVDTGRKVLELTNAVNRVSNLPSGADPPVVEEAKVAPVIISVAVRGTASETVMRSVAMQLEDRLEQLDGVSRAIATGIRDREIQVNVNPDNLAAHNLPLTAVAQALQSRGTNIPAGEIEGTRHNRVVRGMAQVNTAEEVEHVVVRPHAAGGAIHVGDIADVEEGFARARQVARVDGENAIVFLLLKEEGADALRLSDAIGDLLNEFRSNAPPGVEFVSYGDTAFYVRGNLDTLYSNAAMGLVLVLGILWLFVGFRNGLMAALGIPVALAGGILMMHLLGITINILSLLALILSLGIIVDDAIIIIENIFRHIESGMDRSRAAVVGSMEVFWPVVASTATTCAAFLPLLLMTGVLGKFFSIIPKVIVSALVASLIEAFIILPSHMADFGGRAKKKTSEATHKASSFNERIDRRFTILLRSCLKHRYLVLCAAYAICIGLLTTAYFLQDVVLFTDSDVEQFDVRVQMPTDSAEEETDRVLREIERRLLALDNPDVQAVTSIRGYSRSRLFDVSGDNVGMVTVTMHPRQIRSSVDAGSRLMESTFHMFDDIVGPSSLEVIKFEDGPPRGAPVAVRISGDNLDQLTELSEQIQAELLQVAGTRNITDNYELGKRELRVLVDEERAALFGFTQLSVNAWLANALGAIPVTQTRENDEEVDIVVRLNEDVRNNADRLGDLRLISPTGAAVALRDIATIEVGRGISRIRRRNQRRTVTVTSEIVEGATTSSAVNQALRRRIQPIIDANPDIGITLGGEFEDTNESLNSLALAFLVAALLIYTILATQFQSFLQPFVVMTAIPLSMIGVSAGFLISNQPIGLLGLIGVVGLTGIVVNDSLVLVDFINKRRAQMQSLNDAIVEAARLRLRPIFLTSVTTIAGLFPLTLGLGGRSELLAPMATAISWGLTFSTVLILVVVPCLYCTVDGISNGFRRVFRPLTRLALGEERLSALPPEPTETSTAE